jgi:hypothetical protein
MRKIFNQKNYNNFIGTPLDSRVNTNLPPVSLTPVANLPPVSTTLVKLVAKFAAGVVDTGGQP